MSYRERALVALVLSITVVLLMSRGHAQGDRYVPGDCATEQAVAKSLRYLLDGSVEPPLLQSDENSQHVHWECERNGRMYYPDVLHVSAALDLYGSPYDDLVNESKDDAGQLGWHMYSERNPRSELANTEGETWLGVTDASTCAVHYPDGLQFKRYYIANINCESEKHGTLSAAFSTFQTEMQDWRRADDAYMQPERWYFHDPFNPLVQQALTQGLEGTDPHAGDGSNGDDNNGGGGNDLGDGSGDNVPFDEWRPLGDTSDAFAGMRDCVGDAFTHLFQVAQQQMPIMFGEWIPEGMTIDESDTDCTDTSITLLGHTEELPLCDNPIMKNLRRVIRPVLLLVALVQFYIGITRLIAWS